MILCVLYKRYATGTQMYNISLKLNIQYVTLHPKTWHCTYCNTVKVGLIHHVQHYLSHFAVIHCEVMVGVLPLFYPQQFHHTSQRFSDNPNPIVGKAMKLAGLDAFLLKLTAVLPLVFFGGLREEKERKSKQETGSF